MPSEVIQKQEKQLKFKNPYLKKIEDLCAKHHIKLMYYLSPNRKQRASFSTSKQVIINHSDIFENNLYFYDDFHVNKRGNRKASMLFMDEFIKHINK